MKDQRPVLTSEMIDEEARAAVAAVAARFYEERDDEEQEIADWLAGRTEFLERSSSSLRPGPSVVTDEQARFLSLGWRFDRMAEVGMDLLVQIACASLRGELSDETDAALYPLVTEFLRLRRPS